MLHLALLVPVVDTAMSRHSPNRWVALTSRAKRRVAAALLALQAVSSSGCSTWSSVPPSSLPSPAPEQIQVWADGALTLLNGPKYRNDSLIGEVSPAQGSGIPTEVARPLSGVDSLRIKKSSASRTVLAAIGVMAAIGFIVAVSGGLYGDQP